jgi:hypothetical protein
MESKPKQLRALTMNASDATEEGDLDRPFIPIVAAVDLDNWFMHHAPRPGQTARYEEGRRLCKELAVYFAEFTPPGSDQMAAIRKVREALMTANAAIACEHEVQSEYYKLKFERSLQDRPTEESAK